MVVHIPWAEWVVVKVLEVQSTRAMLPEEGPDPYSLSKAQYSLELVLHETVQEEVEVGEMMEFQVGEHLGGVTFSALLVTLGKISPNCALDGKLEKGEKQYSFLISRSNSFLTSPPSSISYFSINLFTDLCPVVLKISPLLVLYPIFLQEI